jgi:hypothetical protein
MVRALLLLVLAVSTADAAWITYRNDTQAPITLQEVSIVNGRIVRGKPVTLAAGETFREFQAAPANRSIELYETGPKGNVLVSTNAVAVKNQDVLYSAKAANGAVRLVAAAK